MSTLDRSRFGEFFRAVRGFDPFAWQERLLDQVVDTGRWPDRIDAPTGTGKTAVVDVHVFANALTAVGAGPRVPRRLALVVGRRVLVDSHHDHAKLLQQRLREPEDGILRDVATALADLAPAGLPSEGSRFPLLVDSLRGGVPAPRSWRVEPEVCAVLACTPDMFGSRLLMRGYGTSRRARPQEAGLLGLDCVAVVDEAHLNRQLVRTARRVAELVSRAPSAMGVPVLQVVDTTATPDAPDATASSDVTVGVFDDDLLADPTLTDRLTRPKPVTLVELPAWPAAASDSSKRAMATVVADEVDRICARLHAADERPQTVGCVLNRVEDAAAVARELRRRTATGAVVLLTGRTRPVDRDVLESRHPGLLSIGGNPGVRVLVATQTLEVGVDVDLAGLVTDLAPGTALAQRAGRVNRRGLRPSGPVSVVVPRDGVSEKATTAPYRADELQAALEWVHRLADDPQGLAPWSLRDEVPPSQEPRRDLWQRLSADDVRHLVRTSAPTFGDPDLALWLADDMAVDDARGLVLRHLVPARDPSPDDEPSASLPVVRLTPPERHETMPLSRRVLSNVLSAYRDQAPSAPVLRYRASLADSGETIELVDEESPEKLAAAFRTADVAILDAALAGPEVLPWLLRVAPLDDAAEIQDLMDVYEVELSAMRGRSARRGQHLRLGAFSRFDSGALEPDQVKEIMDSARRFQEEGVVEDLVAALGEMQTAAPTLLPARVQAVRDLLLTDPASLEVHLSDPDDLAPWAVVLDTRTTLPSEDRLPLWSAGGTVLLDTHQQAVAERARLSAEVLGVTAQLQESLRVAGLHHDDGKVDVRFQTQVLAAPADAEGPWAKSNRPSTSRARRRTAASTLPPGWRHEQLSVLLAARSADLQDAPDTALALRLIGTTHGWGRPSFPHGSVDLQESPVPEDGVDLFDDGGWEDLVERTDLQYGPWGTAYLEALLRAADARISREGS